jgi:hypothetical protein
MQLDEQSTLLCDLEKKPQRGFLFRSSSLGGFMRCGGGNRFLIPVRHDADRNPQPRARRPMSIDCLYTKVIVRRVGVGAAPFAWEVVGAEPGPPLHVSSERFRSMEAAFSAGQDRLAEFLPDLRVHRGERAKPASRQAAAPAIDWHADEADETGVDDDLETDGAADQDRQPRPAILDERAEPLDARQEPLGATLDGDDRIAGGDGDPGRSAIQTDRPDLCACHGPATCGPGARSSPEVGLIDGAVLGDSDGLVQKTTQTPRFSHRQAGAPSSCRRPVVS